MLTWTARSVKIGDVTTGTETWNPLAAPGGTFRYIDIGSVSAADKQIVSAPTLATWPQRQAVLANWSGEAHSPYRRFGRT